MGNHRLEHCRSCISIIPTIMLETTIVETRKQHARVGVIQSLDVDVTTIGVETVVVPIINVFRRGTLIGFARKLGSGSNGISTIRNLNRSSTLPTSTTGVVGIPQMLVTNLIMIIHVNKIANRPLMSLMVTRRYKSIDAMNPKGGY